VLVPYWSLHPLTPPPLGFTVALSVAVVWVTEDGAFVSTVGAFTCGSPEPGGDPRCLEGLAERELKENVVPFVNEWRILCKRLSRAPTLAKCLRLALQTLFLCLAHACLASARR
jgi:hypothetical protein